MIERDLILDYDLVRGLPGDVAERVQVLIAQSEGWQPLGEPKIMKIGECEVIVQPMAQYEWNK